MFPWLIVATAGRAVMVRRAVCVNSFRADNPGLVRMNVNGPEPDIAMPPGACDDGWLDDDTGRAFLVNIPEPGGTRDAMELFVAFRGRLPDVAALPRQCRPAA